MTRYADKVLSGEAPEPADWVEHLKAMHSESPSQTPNAFESPKTQDGMNSYQVLINSAKVKVPSKILDLACGDGNLIPYIKKHFGNDTPVIGIDMSKGELAIAASKKFDKNVTLKCEMADSITEENDSFDFVFCHMALMLMNPVGPVIEEIIRVLKTGGTFAAVVGAGSSQKADFYSTYQEIAIGFLKKKFPKFVGMASGDQRVRSLAGIIDIFSGTGFCNPKIKEFSVLVNVPANNPWVFFKDMYNVSLLPAHLREELRSELSIAAQSSGQKNLSFEFPMRLIVAEKK